MIERVIGWVVILLVGGAGALVSERWVEVHDPAFHATVTPAVRVAPRSLSTSLGSVASINRADAGVASADPFNPPPAPIPVAVVSPPIPAPAPLVLPPPPPPAPPPFPFQFMGVVQDDGRAPTVFLVSGDQLIAVHDQEQFAGVYRVKTLDNQHVVIENSQSQQSTEWTFGVAPNAGSRR